MVIDSGHQWTADAWNTVNAWLDKARQSPDQNVRNAAQVLADAIGPNPPASLLTDKCCARSRGAGASSGRAERCVLAEEA
jgi:hypothetical protein